MFEWKGVYYNSSVSHDSANNRVYITDLHLTDLPKILPCLLELALQKGYTKLFAKVPAQGVPHFICHGYQIEAMVPQLFDGIESGFFMVRYLDESRSVPEVQALQAFQPLLLQGRKSIEPPALPVESLGESHASEIVQVFSQVFESYPFPIFDESFIRQSMREFGTRYFGIRESGVLVAISSAECSATHSYAEMTDFAVLPQCRGQKMAAILLAHMEQALLADSFHTFYTIARLHSLSMNKTFQQAGYQWGGVLTQNTQISGAIESMVVWYKNNSR